MKNKLFGYLCALGKRDVTRVSTEAIKTILISPKLTVETRVTEDNRIELCIETRDTWQKLLTLNTTFVEGVLKFTLESAKEKV